MHEDQISFTGRSLNVFRAMYFSVLCNLVASEISANKKTLRERGKTISPLLCHLLSHEESDLWKTQLDSMTRTVTLEIYIISCNGPRKYFQTIWIVYSL